MTNEHPLPDDDDDHPALESFSGDEEYHDDDDDDDDDDESDSMKPLAAEDDDCHDDETERGGSRSAVDFARDDEDGMMPPLLHAENPGGDDEEYDEEMEEDYEDHEDDSNNNHHHHHHHNDGNNPTRGGHWSHQQQQHQRHDHQSEQHANNATSLGYSNTGMRRTSTCTDGSGSSISDYEDEEMNEFYPPLSRHHEWMGRSVESLVLGHLAKAPMLSLIEDDLSDDDTTNAYMAFRRRSTASTFGGDVSFSRRRSSSGGNFPGSTRRGSLSLMTPAASGAMHGGTMANYYNRRRTMQPMDVDRTVNRRGSATTAHAPSYRRRSSMACSSSDRGGSGDGGEPQEPRAQAGPNITLSLLAREMTGKSTISKPGSPAIRHLRAMGGTSLYAALDKPAAGMATEVAFLNAAADAGDWAEVQAIVSRLAPRLIGDPAAAMQPPESRSAAIDDPNLPPSASPFYAGGGRVGLERDAFVLAGGVEAMIRIFREKTFVGQEMALSYDARDLSKGLVATRLAPCWNEALASLRELIFAIPTLVETGAALDNGDFLPFLFSLLAHDSCFDGAAALIEEILSLMSHSPQAQVHPEEGDEKNGIPPLGRSTPVTTFFLGNVPDLYKLWDGFNCRQLAHFCRILALLVFEPEDRQLLESPAVLKSLELLQLRRNRAVRAGRDSTVDMNQAILLGDIELISRMLKLLRVMNFAPSVRRGTPYHVMAHFPFIADTLVMLGLNEIDSWDEIDRLERLARKLIVGLDSKKQDNSRNNNSDRSSGSTAGRNAHGGSPEERQSEPPSYPLVSELGSVADMLENLATVLMSNQAEPTNQLGHIIHVISAAQRAGVVVGRMGRGRTRDSITGARPPMATQDEEWSMQVPEDDGDSQNFDEDDLNGSGNFGPLNMVGVPVDGNTVQELATAAGMLTDQVLVRQLYAGPGEEYDENPNGGNVQVVGVGMDNPIRADGFDERLSVGRSPITAPKDAANALQFNALLLGPYQVEVLFVLCTLLGGRRKLDAQEKLKRCGVIHVLDDMFQRLPWYSAQREQAASRGGDSEDNNTGTSSAADAASGANSDGGEGEQPNGIHGPGCECTPESALCVQYLRLLHNFCDRDCDNYSGRHQLLSWDERELIFHGAGPEFVVYEPGLLTKIVEAFVRESDESPYRFWLASCIESYLRGSSPEEQAFVARSGLLMHLIDDITSERLHCAGSLQTSFDLLGELCKGNHEVLGFLVSNLDEESFRKFMSVAAANLVDSNVFIRSLWLTLERLSAANRQIPLHFDPSLARGRQARWSSHTGPGARYYLTHSWWDTSAFKVDDDTEEDFYQEGDPGDARRPSDWFPASESVEASGMRSWDHEQLLHSSSGLNESVGHFGWVFSPVGDSLSAATFEPNTMERLSWFLAANQARLLRDLLGVVDLRNINHENICCLNTAVVIAIFAHRRKGLAGLLKELSQMNDEEKDAKRRARNPSSNDDLIDRAFVNAMRYLDLDREAPTYSRRASITSRRDSMGGVQQIGDRNDVMRNFREVLWFWFEYYTHRGRDRLSLEFSSHLRFHEWMQVVNLLVADDGASTSLVRGPVRLPRSPYQSAARVADNPTRGV